MKHNSIKYYTEKCIDLIKKRRSIDLIILAALILFAYRGWFKPGFIVGGDWGLYIYQENIMDYFSFPYIWMSGFNAGNYVISSLIYNCTLFMQAFFMYFFNVGYDVTERLVWYYPFVFLAPFSMYYLSYVLFKKRIICFLSSILFALNTYILIGVTGGHLTIAMGYAFSPLILAFFIKSMKETKLKNSMICGILLAISIFYEPRMTYLSAWIIIAYFLYFNLVRFQSKKLKSYIFKQIMNLGIIFAIPFILHFYWILPSITGVNPLAAVNLPSQPITSFMKMDNALALFHPFWSGGAPTAFKVNNINPLFFLIPILVFSAILLRPNDKNVIFLTLLAIVSVFLVKQENQPFGVVYTWLFQKFPGFNMFREASKFYMITSLAYAPLLGITIDAIFNKLSKINILKQKSMFWKKNGLNIILFCFLLIVTLFLLSLVSPALTGQLHGTFDPHPIPKEYLKIKEFIKQQPDDFRTFWLPTFSMYSFFSEAHQMAHPDIFSDFGRYFLNEYYHYESPYRKTNYIGKILGLANVKYIIVPIDDELYKSKSRDYYLNLLDNQYGLKKIDIGNNISIYENEYVLPRFYGTSNAMLIIGGRSALHSLNLLGIDFSKYTLFFVDQLKDKSLDMWNKFDTIVFYEKGIDDFTLSLVDEKYHVNLRQYLESQSADSEENKWKSSEYSAGDLFGNKHGEISQDTGNYIEALKNATLKVPITIKTSDTYNIYARVGFGPDRGIFSIAIDNLNISSTSFYSRDYVGLRWIKLGTAFIDRGEHTISLYNENGRNSLDSLVIIPKSRIELYQKEVDAIIAHKKLVFIKEAETSLQREKGNWEILDDFGGEASNGKVLSATYRLSETSSTVEIPSDGNYTISFRIAGKSFFDNSEIKDNKTFYKNIELNNLNNSIIINASTDQPDLNVIVPEYLYTKTFANKTKQNVPIFVACDKLGVKAGDTLNCVFVVKNESSEQVNGFQSVFQYLITNVSYNGERGMSNYNAVARVVDGGIYIHKISITIPKPEVSKPTSFRMGFQSFGDGWSRNINYNIPYGETKQGIFVVFGNSNITNIQYPFPYPPELNMLYYTSYLTGDFSNGTYAHDYSKEQFGIVGLSGFMDSEGKLTKHYFFNSNNLSSGRELNVSQYKLNFEIKMDDKVVYKSSADTQNKLKWFETNPVQLKKGKHKITIVKNGAGEFSIDEIIIKNYNSKSTSLFEANNTIPVTWKKINPTKYKVEMNTTNPTFLVFSETYDPLWVAKYDNEEVNSVIAYSAINSFKINKTGNVSITLEYTPQKYVYIGFIISIIGLFSIILYFVVSSKSINRFYSKFSRNDTCNTNNKIAQNKVIP